MAGFFGKLFDLNHDGKLDSLEQTMDFVAYKHMVDTLENNTAKSESEAALESTDLDMGDLEFMDEEERREALEDAGLDPDDFDF